MAFGPQQFFSFKPAQTPSIVRMIIFIVCTTTLGLAIIDQFLGYFWGLPGLTKYIALSGNGLSHLFLWQPITHLFLYPSGGMGVTFSLIIQVCFICYIFWFLGSMLVDHIGWKQFVGLFLFSGIVAGLAAVAVSSPFTLFAGMTGPLLAILLVWAMLYPDAQLYLFFLFPVPARYLVAGLTGLFILTSLSAGDFVSLLSLVTALGCGYLYGLFVLNLHGPFQLTHTFDDWVIGLKQSIRHRKERKQEADSFTNSSARIVDIVTGEAIIDDDDAFVDVMLEKVSRFGEKSLSKDERRRLNEISARKEGQKDKAKT